MMDKKHLSLADAAAYIGLGWSPDAMRKHVKKGTVPAWTWRRIGREYVFLAYALDEWLAADYVAVKGKPRKAA